MERKKKRSNLLLMEFYPGAMTNKDIVRKSKDIVIGLIVNVAEET